MDNGFEKYSFEKYSCEKYLESISLYIDDELSKEQSAKLEQHLSECDECRAFAAELKDLTSQLQTEQIELPEGFHERFMERLKADIDAGSENASIIKFEAKPEKKQNSISSIITNQRWRSFAAMAAGFVFVFLLLTSGLYAIVGPGVYNDSKPLASEAAIEQAQMHVLMDGSGEEFKQQALPGDGFDTAGSAEPTADDSGVYNKRIDQSAYGIDVANGTDAASIEALDAGIDPVIGASSAPMVRMAEPFDTVGEVNIRSYRLDIVVDDFDEAMNNIAPMNAYISQSNMYQDGNALNASITFKIPESEYYDTVNTLKTLGKVNNETENEIVVAYDVADAKARLTAREQEYDNVLALLSRAENVSDILTIETRIDELITEIDSIKTGLLGWLAKQSYPVIDLSLSEKIKVTALPENDLPLFDRMSENFVSSANSTVLFLEGVAVSLSYLIVPAAIVAVAIVVIKSVRRFNKRRFDKQRFDDQRGERNE